MRSSAHRTLGCACLAASVLLPGLLMACADDSGPVRPGPLPLEPYDTLREWGLFEDSEGRIPAEGVVPFTVISPLFSDYALKDRFLYVPEGAKIGYDAESEWRFPVGTILVKSFGYPSEDGASKELIETRLLVHNDDGWAGHTYVWNDAQNRAERVIAGRAINLEISRGGGTREELLYIVPNTNECMDCHGQEDSFNTLGGVSRQLDRTYDYGTGPENQIAHLEALGLFDGPVPTEHQRMVDPLGDAPLLDRARSYMDSNCGSCHRPGDLASQSAFWLSWEHTGPSEDPTNWGVCKVPTSAGGATCGNTFDIVPGRPEESVFVCRMRTTDPEDRMPPLGRRLLHDEGLALIEEWIAAMPEAPCN
ncbi:MAG: SO2930 family diheme c-type cytochrome [Myxococcota bacterium]